MASHSYLTADIVAKEALMLLENNLVMGNLVHRGYRDEFGKDIRGAKPGTSVRIRIPNRFTVTKSPAVCPAPRLNRTSLSLVLPRPM